MTAINAAAGLALVSDLYQQLTDTQHQLVECQQELNVVREQYERLAATVRASAGVPGEEESAPPS